MLKFLYFFLCGTIISILDFCTFHKSRFDFKKQQQGVILYENSRPVFFYQRELKTPDNKMYFNNYLHPLYSLEGDTITEEFPLDHPHHRGIFWAWHQIYLNNKNIGDSWVRENISEDVIDLQTKTSENTALLSLNILWRSSLVPNKKPFVDEHTVILVHQLENEIRAIDFEIRLRALVPGVSIGGSNDEKGYGGFCARIKHPQTLTFTSEGGPLLSQMNQIKAGSWMDFSNPNGRNGDISGITILCHPSTPNYPAPWILRGYEASMQNIVFPGRDRVEISMNKVIVLRYRLIIHRGDMKNLDMQKIKAEYENISTQVN